MDEKMNVSQVLAITLNVLREIRIPVELAQEVGMPILGAMSNLRLCLEALEKAGKTDPSGAAAPPPRQAGEAGETSSTAAAVPLPLKGKAEEETGGGES